MKLSEMRELSVEELNQQVEATRKELFESKLKNSLQQLENPSQLRNLKHRIAQLKTVISQKQVALVTGGQAK